MASQEEITAKEILCYGFNQDASCLAVGLRTGYRIYTCRPFAQCFAMTDGGIGRAEMLFSSSLVALVGSGDRPAFSPRRLRLWNTKKDHSICEVNFQTAVLSVKLNRKRVAVCLKQALHVFDISDMKCLRTLETALNPDGVMALSPNDDNCHLAFPDGARGGSSGSGNSTGGGEVILYDALDLKVLNKVMACRSRVVAVSFSRDGNLLATASEQGTVIRIFTVPAAVKTYTLRRGTTSCGIHSMSFNAAATRLAVSSSNRTIHIFDVSANAGECGGGGGGGSIIRERGRTRHRTTNHSGHQGSIAGRDFPTTSSGEGPEAKVGHIGVGGSENNSGRQKALTAEGSIFTSTSTWISNNKEGAASGGGLASGLRSVVGLLPNRVTKRVQDYVDSNRSFASVRLRGSAGRSICALIPAGDVGSWGLRGSGRGSSRRRVKNGSASGNKNNVRGGQDEDEDEEEEEEEGEILLVVTNEGIMYSYAVDTVRGGECRLEQASSLLMDVSGGQEMIPELFETARCAPPVLAGQG